MKKATNRILSFLTAFAMVIGVLVAPFTSANAAEKEPTQTTVVLTKVLLENLEGWPKEANTDVNGVNYIGQNLGKAEAGTDFAKYFGTEAKTLENVEFKITKIDKEGNETPYNNGETFKTDANGQFKVTLPNGKYRIEEISTSYVGPKGETITDSAAVPVEIELPMVRPDGTYFSDAEGDELYIYPKNVRKAPKIDKNFKQGNKLTEIKDENKNLGAGAVYENYTKEKALASQELDKNVPYEIKTEIPAKAKYAQAYWDDIMTKGLTYNKDLLVTIDGEPAELGTDYTLERNEDNGFKAVFTEAGLKKINNQAAAVTVMLTYSAKINKDAVIDIPESNNVRFFYGNNKGKGNTPIPTNPNENGEIKVKKTWDNGSAWADGEEATFKLVDANTGKDVTADQVDAVDGYEFKGTVKLSKDTLDTYTWKGLKKDKQYKVVEVSSTTLSDAVYKKNADGDLEVTNYPTNNPAPLEPTTPKVVTYGKKFVKVNEEDQRLKGAKFKIKNKGTGKYLAEKAEDQITKDKEAATAAKTELDNAITAYNDNTDEEQTAALKAAVEEKQKALNAAVVKANEFYVWVEEAKAKEFTSNAQGQFEVTRLDKGTYTLVETEAPTVDNTKYAKRDDIDFEVGPNSYSTGDIKYNEDDKAENALKVVNRKVSIPQTGGIGSLIFIVAGLAIMGLAFVMKRRNTVEA